MQQAQITFDAPHNPVAALITAARLATIKTPCSGAYEAFEAAQTAAKSSFRRSATPIMDVFDAAQAIHTPGAHIVIDAMQSTLEAYTKKF